MLQKTYRKLRESGAFFLLLVGDPRYAGAAPKYSARLPKTESWKQS